MPVAIGMQVPILDEAAVEFAQEFYGAWAAGQPIEGALAYARRLIGEETPGAAADWSTPVLFMGPVEGLTLDLAPPPPSVPRAVRFLRWSAALFLTLLSTIGLLLTHIAVAETFWINAAPREISDQSARDEIIRDIIGIKGDEDGLPLPESGTRPKTLSGKSIDDYLKMLANCRAATHSVLKTWMDDSLESTYILEEKYSFTRSWTLYHVLEHLASHLGQVLMLKHMMRDAGILPQSPL